MTDRRRTQREIDPFGTALHRFALRTGRMKSRVPAQEIVQPIKTAARGLDLAPQIVDLAFDLASRESGLDPSERRSLLLLLLAAIAGNRQGSTRLPLANAGRGTLADLVGALSPSGDRRAEISRIARLIEDDRAPSVIGGKGGYTPLIASDGYIHLQRVLRQEEMFVHALAPRIRAGDLALDQRSLAEALADVRARPSTAKGAPLALSEEQALAVERAVLRRFSVISGGPGTGKTSIVVSIVRVLARLGLGAETIALAAPTGKAAKRIADSVRRGLESIADPAEIDRALLVRCPDAETLHRLLGYSPSSDRFRHHENNRLAERTLIVDESSMIDLGLMERLVRSSRDDARLILLGDAEQLPSVDAGVVLRDLAGVESETAFTTTLSHSYRMSAADPGGRHIALIAARIRQGADLLDAEGLILRDQPRDLSFTRVEMVQPRQRSRTALLEAMLERWYLERLRAPSDIPRLAEQTYALDGGRIRDEDAPDVAALLAHLEQLKILCITRGPDLPTGAESINQSLHRRALRDAGVSGLRWGETPWLAGEPLMVEQNDYDRGLFNGDQGVVLKVRDALGGESQRAVFASSGAFVAHPLDPLSREVALSYAMTVHKAQGSELDGALIVLPDEDIALLTRELLYTAVTRCRRSVVILGDPALLVRAVERRAERHSGLGDRLRAALDPA
jgi:exodeoxyribonuclease V alpha subunit